MRKHFAYYNEFDPKAAAWLRELIRLGEIMDGEVDERSIAEVRPDDLAGFTRCHFFAGIGGWDLALRKAGWREDVPVWTGSCPCQAFSCAGQRKGFEDERDLWPVFFNLIHECGPDVVLGEQVKNAVKFGWLDRLYTDLEGEGYACGSAVLGAHSAGADHIRQRIYWVADSERQRCQRRERKWETGAQRISAGYVGKCDGLGGMVFSCEQGLQGHAGNVGDGNEPGRVGTLAAGPVAKTGGSRRLGDATFDGPEVRTQLHGELRGQGLAEGRKPRNFWSDAVPHLCKDGKYRRFEPRVFPLAHGLPRGVGYSGDPRLPEYVNSTAEARVVRLKGYGNAIVPETAAMFVRAVMDELDGKEVIA